MGALPQRPTIDDVQRFVFTPGCTEASCHDTATKAGALDLSSAEVSYRELVEVSASNPSAKSQNLLRVVSGDPDSSFLFRKLVSPGPGEGTPMPTVDDRLAAPYLDLVARWIEQGAAR